MSLVLLPDTQFPVTSKQCDALVENLVQFNIIDAGLNHMHQRAIALIFKIAEVRASKHLSIDYTGTKGHARLMDDAMAFAGHGNAFATRHGDVLAAHLAIAYHNAQVKTKKAGLEPLPDNVNDLIAMASDFLTLAPQTEERLDLYLSWLKKSRNA